MKGTNIPLNTDELPGMLNPGEFDSKKYEDIFRKAANIRLTDDMIVCPLLGYAIENSLRAAASRGSLLYCLSEKGKKDFEDSIRDELAHTLFESFLKIPSLIKFDYRSWHGSLCQKLIDICKGLDCEKGCGWTYGNSQKVVNLTVKYLVITAKAAKKIRITNEATEIGDAFLAIEDDLDIPVDSYIIEASWNHNQRQGSKPLVLPYQTKNHDDKHSSNKVKAWSKWSEDDYNKYSGSLHKSFEQTKHPPLDWEGYAWIEAKKMREKKNIDDQGL